MTRMRTDTIDWDAVPLGEIPDEEIALAVGRALDTVATERRRRGIPPAEDRRLLTGHERPPLTRANRRPGRGALVRTCLEIMRDLAASPRTIKELAELHGINYRTAYRYVDTITEAGVTVAHSRTEGLYSIRRDDLRRWLGV